MKLKRKELGENKKQWKNTNFIYKHKHEHRTLTHQLNFSTQKSTVNSNSHLLFKSRMVWPLTFS